MFNRCELSKTADFKTMFVQLESEELFKLRTSTPPAALRPPAGGDLLQHQAEGGLVDVSRLRVGRKRRVEGKALLSQVEERSGQLQVEESSCRRRSKTSSVYSCAVRSAAISAGTPDEPQVLDRYFSGLFKSSVSDSRSSRFEAEDERCQLYRGLHPWR